MDLATVWFFAVMILWIGYFVLEGFDFGVGMSLGLLGRSEQNRKAMIATIGPVWDGNEVWVITAAGAMFAAFPGWYATTFSAFYLPLLAILFGLIIRAVAFEFREQREDASWHAAWDRCIMIGSLLPAVLWGMILAGMVRGLPIDADQVFTGNLGDLLHPFALLGGLATGTIFLAHGAVFLALKTTGDLRSRAKRMAAITGPVAGLVGVGFLIWLNLLSGSVEGAVLSLSVIAVLGLTVGPLMERLDRDGWSFLGTCVGVAGLVLALFGSLYPRLLPSTTNPAWSLTIAGSSATDYTLTIMTWSAAILLPLVLLYQGWTYWIFRKRITAEPAGAH